MAATPKHRRSRSKKRSTMASNRYDVVLTKFRKLKKKGGSIVSISKESGVAVPSHMVTLDHTEYKGVKVISKKKKAK